MQRGNLKEGGRSLIMIEIVATMRLLCKISWLIEKSLANLNILFDPNVLAEEIAENLVRWGVFKLSMDQFETNRDNGTGF